MIISRNYDYLLIDDPFTMANTTDTSINTRDIHNKRVAGMSRRRLLTTLTGLGFGSTAAAHLTVDDVKAATDDQVPIVIGFERENPKQPDAEPITKNVPADWYDDIQRARAVHKEIDRAYGGQDGIVGVGIDGAVRGGKNSHITVDILPNKIGELRGTVPEYVDDVPIKVNETSVPTPDACDEYDLRDDETPYIPGGNQCEAGVGSESIGTLLPRMYDSDRNIRFATATHLFNNGGNGNNYNGEELFHPRDWDTHIGTVVTTHCHNDLVVAEREDTDGDGEPDQYPMSEIEQASPDIAVGQFTEDGLEDLKSQGEWVSKMGRTTCETSGPIKDTRWTYWSGYGCVPRTRQVKYGWSHTSEGGDSGAPVYHPSPTNDDVQWIVCVNQFSSDSGDYAGGNSAYKLKNDHGYQF